MFRNVKFKGIVRLICSFLIVSLITLDLGNIAGSSIKAEASTVDGTTVSNTNNTGGERDSKVPVRELKEQETEYTKIYKTAMEQRRYIHI